MTFTSLFHNSFMLIFLLFTIIRVAPWTIIIIIGCMYFIIKILNNFQKVILLLGNLNLVNNNKVNAFLAETLE